MRKQEDNKIEKNVEDKDVVKKKVNQLEEEWAQGAQDELEDFIESQGIYIRQ